MTQRSPSVSHRRVAAPVRPRRPVSTVPDLLVAIAVMGWAMAALFAVASFSDDNVTAGEAGPILARLFAAALGTFATFVFVLALALLRDERGDWTHYGVPTVVGVVAGTLVAFLLLETAGAWIFAPLLLLLFALRPLRSAVARALGRRPLGAR
jgi:hypothetical protein